MCPPLRDIAEILQICLVKHMEWKWSLGKSSSYHHAIPKAWGREGGRKDGARRERRGRKSIFGAQQSEVTS